MRLSQNDYHFETASPFSFSFNNFDLLSSLISVHAIIKSFVFVVGQAALSLPVQEVLSSKSTSWLTNELLGLFCLNYLIALNYGHLVFSELLCSPAGGLTFLFRQESKQRTDQRRGAEVFPIGTLYALVPCYLGNKPPSPLDSSPGMPVSFSCFVWTCR